MCIRDRDQDYAAPVDHSKALRDCNFTAQAVTPMGPGKACLVYTSDAADERSSVDLGGRRIIKERTVGLRSSVLSAL
mgnify:CR=1 FL=1